MKELYTALSKAQGEFPTIPKKGSAEVKKNNTVLYQYSYATYPDIIEAIKPILSKHELTFMHITENNKLVTYLAHSSGDIIGTHIDIPSLAGAQQFGAWLQLMKRYQLTALLGIAADDDVEPPIEDNAESDTISQETAEYIKDQLQKLEIPVADIAAILSDLGVGTIRQIKKSDEGKIINKLALLEARSKGAK